MSMHKIRAVFKDLTAKVDRDREAALFEVQELKKDLGEMQRHLSGRKKQTSLEPEDFIRSAYDIAHHFRGMKQRLAILQELEEEMRVADALEYLESRGAKMLQRPAGWHWTSSQDERFLLHEDDPLKAEKKLRTLLANGKRRKKTRKKKK
ncbi:hypothetical protein [Pseudodesulfovibrio senegalensis]|jgi:hypothetical protein|uniref:Uncharacterized protein n=1 Tax=Pseudodesulfovibrio senegalensis TaxID=1721087 RepID=A0A6N6N2Y4_9BACT|nr:hypothetical protein [Pseudodesulfovibrio senegalensis]KAB1440912.1 hypothetical protein F8A88_13290 [Pseudodesulfovibrio senegalensis]